MSHGDDETIDFKHAEPLEGMPSPTEPAFDFVPDTAAPTPQPFETDVMASSITEEAQADTAKPEEGEAKTGEEAVKEGAEGEKAEEGKEEEEKEPSGLLHWLANSEPYTVMLGIAVVAIVVGALCLLAEWQRYSRDTKAGAARRPTAMAPAAHLGPAGRTPTV